jgi:hypothetical protein
VQQGSFGNDIATWIFENAMICCISVFLVNHGMKDHDFRELSVRVVLGDLGMVFTLRRKYCAVSLVQQNLNLLSQVQVVVVSNHPIVTAVDCRVKSTLI